jgi:hypothetical protein
MRQKLCKQFKFEEVNRPLITFSDSAKIRLDPTTHQLELKIQSYYPVTGAAIYSLDTDLTVTTWITNPTALVAWAGFSMQPMSLQQPDDTQINFKLNDGTNDRYWDGGAWAVAGAADWNTEAEVAANIATYPATSKQLGLVINLVTTDRFVTPTVELVELLMDLEIDYVRSIIAGSLEPALRGSINPIVDYTIKAPGGSKLDLRDVETAFNILDVDAVYNHTDDSDHVTDLLSTYSTTTKTITLTGAVDRGKDIWIRFLTEPEVYLDWGSQDYVEVTKLPAIAIENFDLSGNTVNASMIVKDVSDNTAIVRRVPFRLMIEFDVVLLAEKNRTLLSMMDQALKFMVDTPLLNWIEVDEKISMYPLEEGLFRQRPSMKDEHASRISMRMENIYLWLRSEDSVNLIENVNYTLTDNTLQGGARWTGIKAG